MTRVRAMLRVACDSEREQGNGGRDGLTKVYNRRYFDERIEMEIERARRYGRKVSCAMFDVDNFKNINDRHGHTAGDRILKSLADILLSQTRSSDIVARYGGEEFVVILPETAGREASISSERVRKAFEELELRFADDDSAVTVSCGIATYPDHAADSSTLLRMADSALYRAKSEGRNRSMVAFSDSESEFCSSGSTSAKILIVEDNDYSRCVASLVLRASGYEVLEATGGQMGISLARTTHPDLVIVDLQLHDMNGLEATRQIVELDANRSMAVVALTASALPDDLEALARVGCRGYITKPIDTDMLASQIQIYLDE
jgi:diguanylate cyclase (GGDEF)-like protein